MICKARMGHDLFFGHVTGHAVSVSDRAAALTRPNRAMAGLARLVEGRDRSGQVAMWVMAGGALQTSFAFVIAAAQDQALGVQANGSLVTHDLC